MDRGATVHGVARVRHNLVTNQQKQQSQTEKDKYQMISLRSGIKKNDINEFYLQNINRLIVGKG